MDIRSLLPLIFLVLGVTTLFITFKMKLEKDVQKDKKSLDTFYEKELKAQFTRKKEIPSSFFISIDPARILFVNHSACKTLYEQVLTLSKRKMTNLKAYTNLQLKESYGIAQFEQLITYEKNYLTFMDILVKYGTIVYENGYVQEAKAVLETALDYQCDVSKCYIMLSAIYLKLKDKGALEYLKSAALQNMEGNYYLNKVLLRIEETKQQIDL